MAISLNGSSQYASKAGAVASNEPFLMLIWGNPDIITAQLTAMSLGNNGATGIWWLATRGATAGDPVSALKQDDVGSDSVFADSAAGFVSGAWQLFTAMFISDTSRNARLDGANEGTDATAGTDPTPDFTTIGAIRRGSVIQHFDGLLAEGLMADVEPTEKEYLRLASGIRPRYWRPDHHLAYWPLLDDANDKSGNGHNLTETGAPTYTTHPQMRGDAGMFA